MELSIGNLILIIAYFLIVFAIGFWVRRRESIREYLNANRSLGLLQTTASIVAVMGGMILVAQATMGFEMGLAAIWYFVGMAFGMLFLGSYAGKVKRFALKKNFLTLSDYFMEKFDQKTRLLSAIIIFIALFALLVGQFIAAGSLFSPLLGVPYWAAVLLMMFGVLVYLVLGGFKAVVKTDVLQFFIMTVVFCSLLFVIDVGDYTPEQVDLGSIGGSYIIAFLLIGTFAVLSGADIWQRVFAARNTKTARNASFLSAAIFLLFGAVLTFIGIAARNNFPAIKPEEALYYGLFQLVPLPLMGLVIIFVLAAIMSTIDTELFYLSSSIAKDFQSKLSEEKLAKNIRKYIIVLALVSALIAILFSNIITIVFGMISLSLAVSPTLAASFFWKIKKNAAFLSMIAGLLSLIVLAVSGNFTPDNSILPLPVAILFLIIGQVVFKKK